MHFIRHFPKYSVSSAVLMASLRTLTPCVCVAGVRTCSRVLLLPHAQQSWGAAPAELSLAFVNIVLGPASSSPVLVAFLSFFLSPLLAGTASRLWCGSDMGRVLVSCRSGSFSTWPMRMTRAVCLVHTVY